MKSIELEIYGRLTEGVHPATYSFERACIGHLEWLLKEDRWKLDGEYDDVDAFLESLKLDGFRIVVEQHKRIAPRLKKLRRQRAAA
jgi:hypothetical protein